MLVLSIERKLVFERKGNQCNRSEHQQLTYALWHFYRCLIQMLVFLAKSIPFIFSEILLELNIFHFGEEYEAKEDTKVIPTY